jgi:hypothetical protein
MQAARPQGGQKQQASLFGICKRRSPAQASCITVRSAFAAEELEPAQIRVEAVRRLKLARKMTGLALVKLPHTREMHTAKAHFPTFSAGVQFGSPCSVEYP